MPVTENWILNLLLEKQPRALDSGDRGRSGREEDIVGIQKLSFQGAKKKQLSKWPIWSQHQINSQGISKNATDRDHMESRRYPDRDFGMYHGSIKFIGSILHDVTPHTDGASMKLLEVCMFSCAVCKLPSLQRFLINKTMFWRFYRVFRILADELSPFPCNQVVSNVLIVCAWVWKSPSPGALRIMMVWPRLMKWARLCKQW